MTSQGGELARVKARIKALAVKTVDNGCTEAEALAAAEMVGRLLERYALSMDEIELRQEVCVQVEVALRGRQRRPAEGCVLAIARLCDCKVWMTAKDGGRACVFFGFDADAAMARYLFLLIDHAIATEVAGFRPRAGGAALRQAGRGFRMGMAARLSERLDAMHRAREDRVAAQRSSGTTLMLVKQTVVEDAFRATAIRLVSATRRIIAPDAGAYRTGQAAADRVNLNRPVHGPDRSRLR